MTDEEVAAYGRRAGSEATGFGALETERGLLPLVAMEVDARVTGVVAAIEVAQTFVNTTGAAIEATYIFPLPDRAAVNRFRMEVAGRVIEGVIDERGAAREQYDAAIAAGHRAAITEEERAGVFTLRVGNLMPGESATVRLSLVGPLPVDDGEITFRFPLVVAPRYMPGAGLAGDQAGLGIASDTDLVPDASRISPPVLLPGCPNPVRLGLRVTIEDPALRDLASSLHAVTTSNADAKLVQVQPGERLDRDFILRWRNDGAALGSSLVCADDADGKAGTFMLTLVPPSTASLAAKPRDVVFVIDRSGSMEGWKMVAARRAAARMIDTLTSRDTFCALVFDNAVDCIPEPRLEPATDRNRFRAVEALAKVDARGGTELAEPLRRALALLGNSYEDRERVIVLVTDGQVGNEDHILRELAPHMGKTRMFTLGIDQAVNAAFLKRLAGAGGGLCELVESEDRLDAVMAKVHRRIGTPIATELGLKPSNLDVDRATIAPTKLPDVYAGAPVVVFGRYRGAAPANAALDIDGASFGDAFHATIPVIGERAHVAWLGASWARARIRDLEDRYAAGEHALEPDIVATSKRFGVLSRFTAFLAVDRSEIANRGGRIHQVVQAVESPAGWEKARGGGGGMPRRGSFTGHAMPAAPMMPMGAPVARSAMPRAEAKAMSTPTLGGPGSMPPPPPAQAPAPIPMYMPREREVKKDESTPIDASAYLAALGKLAIELEATASNAAIVRLVRQRLAEWVEDVRSVGGNDELATAVEHLVKRLSAALALGGSIEAEARAVAAELGKLAAGTPPPRGGRVAFWK
jgi:Ca-activated chloride channel family protein